MNNTILNCKNEWNLRQKLINSIITYFVELNPAFSIQDCYDSIFVYVSYLSKNQKPPDQDKYYEIGKTLIELYQDNIIF